MNKVAIVTGGTRGIGKAISIELAELGYDITVSARGLKSDGSLDEYFGKEVKEQIETLGVKCLLVRADVSSTDDRVKLVDAVKKEFGRCDLLVNNAGVAPLTRTDLLDATEESFERVLHINLQGPYFLTQLVANWMIKQKRDDAECACRIINIGSISAYTSSPTRGEYCVSKAGMGMMTALYADRLAEFGIGVFEIRPGIIETDMTAGVKEKYDKLILGEGLIPSKRWGQGCDVSKAIKAIAEGGLDFSTGQVLNVDGGFHLRKL